MFFAGNGQLNIQIPWELKGQSQATLTTTIGGITYKAITINLAPYAPGIYTMNGGVNGQGAIVSATTGQIVAPAGSIAGLQTTPATKGDFLTIYCTGLGTVTIQPPSGDTAPLSQLSYTQAKVTSIIGGVSAPVTFAGLTPGDVGLYQVNVQLPDGVPIGAAIPLAISVGGVSSNQVTIAVQ